MKTVHKINMKKNFETKTFTRSYTLKNLVLIANLLACSLAIKVKNNLTTLHMIVFNEASNNRLQVP